MSDTGEAALMLTTKLIRSLIQEGVVTKEEAIGFFDNLLPVSEEPDLNRRARELVEAARESIAHLHLSSWK